MTTQDEQRYSELKAKTNRSADENTELAQLEQKHNPDLTGNPNQQPTR